MGKMCFLSALQFKILSNIKTLDFSVNVNLTVKV